MSKKDNDSIPFDENNYTHNIDRNRERRLDRRGFMKTMVGAAGLFAVSTLPWGGIAAKELMGWGKRSYPVQRLADVSSLHVGDSLEFHYPNEHVSALLVKTGENEYHAYQNACTHLLCPVFYSPEKEKLVCPCHKGYFDVKTGAPTAGPPRRPLPEISLEISGGAIYATGVLRYET